MASLAAAAISCSVAPGRTDVIAAVTAASAIAAAWRSSSTSAGDLIDCSSARILSPAVTLGHSASRPIRRRRESGQSPTRPMAAPDGTPEMASRTWSGTVMGRAEPVTVRGAAAARTSCGQASGMPECIGSPCMTASVISTTGWSWVTTITVWPPYRSWKFDR